MSISKTISNFNATNMKTGEVLKDLLNEVVQEKACVRVLAKDGAIVLVKPDDLMPQGVRITGVCPVEKVGEFPPGRLTFAMFGNNGFETESNDPFEILKEVEDFKKKIEGDRQIQFTKGLEIKISKDLAKKAKAVFIKHERKARVLLNKDEANIIEEKVKNKFKVLGSDENFAIIEEGEEHYGITFDGSFCNAVVKAADELTDAYVDILISVKTSVLAIAAVALKAKEDVNRVIKSIKK